MTPDAPTPRSPMDRLRDELDRDARLLQALTPGSGAHQRLAARIEERTRQLLDRIEEQEESERRYRAAMLAESTRRQAAQLSEGAHRRRGFRPHRYRRRVHRLGNPDSLAASDHLASLATSERLLVPPAFDASGYLEAIERCRELFPGLRILSGLELGEPHWHAEAISKVLGTGRFDRVLGSLHCLPDGDGFSEPAGLYQHRDAAEVVRRYLVEVATLVTTSDAFSVLAHIDYPVRSWPSRAGPFDAFAFEEEFRHALRATARSGRALEINTRRPLQPAILRWWHEEGGEAITFGSDAHEPDGIARRFQEATHMAETHGFRPGRDPLELWARVN